MVVYGHGYVYHDKLDSAAAANVSIVPYMVPGSSATHQPAQRACFGFLFSLLFLAWFFHVSDNDDHENDGTALSSPVCSE